MAVVGLCVPATRKGLVVVIRKRRPALMLQRAKTIEISVELYEVMDALIDQLRAVVVPLNTPSLADTWTIEVSRKERASIRELDGAYTRALKKKTRKSASA